MHKIFIFFILSRILSIRTRYGRVAEALRHGLNFSTAWRTMQLISGEKDWKRLSVQKVVTLNICCNADCLTFHLPHITIGSFQNHQCQHTTGFFRSTNVWRKQHTFSQMKKSCILQGSVVTFFRCGG